MRMSSAGRLVRSLIVMRTLHRDQRHVDTEHHIAAIRAFHTGLELKSRPRRTVRTAHATSEHTPTILKTSPKADRDFLRALLAGIGAVLSQGRIYLLAYTKPWTAVMSIRR